MTTQTNETVSHTKEYLIIFAVLAILTAVEVAIANTSLPKMTIVEILVVLAFGKAACVAAFYMHLKGEGFGLVFIAALPFVLASGYAIAVIGLFKGVH